MTPSAPRTHPSSMQFGARAALIGNPPADEVADSHSARLPSSTIGEKSRRAPGGRGVADGRGGATAGGATAGGATRPAVGLRLLPDVGRWSP